MRSDTAAHTLRGTYLYKCHTAKRRKAARPERLPDSVTATRMGGVPDGQRLRSFQRQEVKTRYHQITA